ncbi:amino acid ABC transporter substrate-binding protein, PAAT family [Tindallia magadiensis]|uniref:Amino acid ABC transporter substrate-binding protein, PAAT family n=1 Tax=Tindallia magadiensis TaxID=69895 RepID=A0A1I3GT84_9FIRM|nr:transporter substrate-binding domain-containing protein [Tindallia magadiensis]SFI26718.1 amino acid ABC transporter substrate-binding protein, PAAT family [Tindallia magadiensis]
MNSKRFFFLGLTFMISVVLLIGCGHDESVHEKDNKAASEQDHIHHQNGQDSDTNQVLRILGEKDFAPISYEEDGEIKGISPDIIREVFDRMDHEISLELIPWARVQAKVAEGEADAFFSPYFTEERNRIYLFPEEPLLYEENVFFVPIDSDITFDGTLESLRPYTIGTILGYVSLEQVDTDNILTIDDQSTSTEQAIERLLNNRGIDLFMNTNYIVWNTLQEMGKTEEVKELSPPLNSFAAYLAFTREKDYTELAKEFDRILREMKEDGTYQSILDSYTK